MLCVFAQFDAAIAHYPPVVLNLSTLAEIDLSGIAMQALLHSFFQQV